uniref:PPC domain-containing protein n=1 Tax=Cucumis sativus TaxID=3659 RepID=A0A0A0LJP1_CUCSA
MFPKPHHQPPSHSQPFPRSFPVTATPPPRDSPDDDSPAAPSPLTHAIVLKEPPSSADGASIEVARRPRGRPPGSKNKPKPAAVVVANRDAEPPMSPYVLEVPGGSDIVEAISRFCRRRNTGLCILNAYGTVGDVTLRQPASSPVGTVTFHGRFDILSVCATFVPQTTSFPIPNGFTITLAGPQGQIFGGLVAGSLIGVGTVYVIAASFNNPSYQRLPSEDEVRKLTFSDVEEGHSPISGGKDSENTAAGGAQETCGLLPMYSTHSSSDVIWTPAARQPAHHHRQY